MTAPIIDVLCTKHVMGVTKHSLCIRKQSPHPPQKRNIQVKMAQIMMGEEIRYGEEYRHWAGVILHLTSSGE
jgi:hypothetical protein